MQSPHSLSPPLASFLVRWIGSLQAEGHSNRPPRSPLIVGIQGPQGSGKSMLSRAIVGELETRGVRTAALSLDDFYLTQAELQKKGVMRGMPGTHDLTLAQETFQALRESLSPPGKGIALPRFDKALHGGLGDRLPRAEWPVAPAPVDVVIFEGWMLGFAVPEYEPLWNQIDAWVSLRPEPFERFIDWRADAEREQRERRGADAAMSDEKVRAYIRGFLPTYERYLPIRPDPAKPLLEITLGQSHTPLRIHSAGVTLSIQDPFALEHTTETGAHGRAQIHSELVDLWLGLETERVEKVISGSFSTPSAREHRENRRENHWIGLPCRSLMTPYSEIAEVLRHLDRGDDPVSVLDLGAAYGRFGLYAAFSTHAPRVSVTGYEVVSERVHEGNRVLLNAPTTNSSGAPERVKLLAQDLTAPQFKLPPADAYLMYDYGSRAAIEHTLRQIQVHAADHPVVVVARGRLTRDLIERENPWLSQVAKPEHHGNFSIFRS